jgi:transcriptional regulator with XRE-family HTH domain
MLYSKYNKSTPTRRRDENTMPSNDFGEFIRMRRTALRLSLRSFAEKAGLDAGNASRLERGRVAPPESQELLNRIASALELRRGSSEYQQLFDLAAAAKGRIPEDLLSDEEVAARLPILFRTLRSKPLSGEQLDKLIDSIRRA